MADYGTHVRHLSVEVAHDPKPQAELVARLEEHEAQDVAPVLFGDSVDIVPSFLRGLVHCWT